MKQDTIQFLLSVCNDILGNYIDHDCKREDGCTYCLKAFDAREALQKLSNPTNGKTQLLEP